MSGWDGTERRAENLELGWKAGHWWMRHSRTMVAVTLVHFMLLAFVATGVAVTNRQAHDELEQNNHIAKDSQLVSDYVRQCLIMKPGTRDPNICGPDNSAALLASLVKYWNCSLLILPEERTAALLDDCARVAFGG